ncbi:MAG: NfeD family protein [Pseudomonadota bacterium]
MLDLPGLFEDAAAWWLIIGLVLFLLELATFSLFLIWAGAAALIMGLLLLVVDIPVTAQLVIFSVLGVTLTYLGRAYFAKSRSYQESDRPNLNNRLAEMVGKQVVALGDFGAGHGTVKVGDSQWAARAPGDGAVRDGETLKVVDVDGTTLIVEPA